MENAQRPDTGWRTLDPDIASALRRARQSRGWSIRRAGRELDVAASMICHLERGERRPSTVLAEVLIHGYGMAPADARRVRAIALANVGRDSPWKRGNAR